MSWVPTDVHHECQTSFRTVFLWVGKFGSEMRKQTATLTIAQDAYTSSQQPIYSCSALQQPSCAVSPILSTTFGLAPLLIRYLIARLGRALV
jgi:hypothetical protein